MNVGQKKLLEAMDAFAQGMVEVVMEKMSKVRVKNGAVAVNGYTRPHADMTCRYPDCKKRSKGPRFRYLCSDHRRIGEKRARKLLEQYRQARA